MAEFNSLAAVVAQVKCPDCGADMRPGGLDCELCPNCGPVGIGLDLPPDWETLTVDQLIDRLGPSAFNRLLERLK